MRPTLPPAVLLSQLLDLHLTRTIDRAAKRDEAEMSKFLQLADDIEADLKHLDQRADDLAMIRRRNRERADEILDQHEDAQNRVAEGMRRMDAVLNDMGGSNSRKLTEAEKAALAAKDGKTNEGTAEKPALGEGSGDTSDSSFPEKKD